MTETTQTTSAPRSTFESPGIVALNAFVAARNKKKTRLCRHCHHRTHTQTKNMCNLCQTTFKQILYEFNKRRDEETIQTIWI
jgi:ribosomal protein L37E